MRRRNFFLVRIVCQSSVCIIFFFISFATFVYCLFYRVVVFISFSYHTEDFLGLGFRHFRLRDPARDRDLIQCPVENCDGTGHISGNFATHRRQATAAESARRGLIGCTRACSSQQLTLRARMLKFTLIMTFVFSCWPPWLACAFFSKFKLFRASTSETQ